MPSTLTSDIREFRAPQSMTTEELGDNLARLVWETFSDFVAREDVDTSIPTPEELAGEDGSPVEGDAEEALIFFMWAHTRGAQQAFLGRIPDDRIRRGLDAMHQAVFEDMVQHGTPVPQIPLFEARIGTRYHEYHLASAESDERLGKVVCRNLAGGTPEYCRQLAHALTERAIAVANPLRDFLEEVNLVD